MILMYHKVSPNNPSRWWVDVDNFYRQMCELKCKKVVYLDEYNMNDKNQIVITFDDAYKNVLDYAAPILKDFGFPYEIFVAGDLIGRDNSFDAPEPPADLASKENLRELVSLGARLQWHSRTHANLRDVKDPETIRYELTIPEEIKALDKKGFKWFAYPYGDFNEVLVKEIKKRFKGALSCIQGKDRDRFKLNRITVTNSTSFKKNRIGVIITSYNYGAFLKEAIESVLKQKRPVDEILIADDHSSDNTMEIGLEYQRKYPDQIKYICNEQNIGLVNNLNKAIANTTAEYICSLDADNRLRCDYIERTAEILDSNDRIGIAYSDFALFGPRAEVVYKGFSSNWLGGVIEGYYYIIRLPEFNKVTKKEMLSEINIMHGSSLYRRKAFNDVRGYKDENNDPEDYVLFRSMIQKGWDAKRVPAPILEYRQHSVEQRNIVLTELKKLELASKQKKA